MSGKIVIRGEQFITFVDAAACFGVSVHWIEEVHDQGLLTDIEQTQFGLALAASLLDRLAAIRRLQLQQELSLAEIANWLDWI
ncbi:MAG: hypothetical protein IT462_14580 [Planctomycetes bacterium]|nr:hypothetical protein [Planctomycetota bacterium]